jgi:inhibitor of cysteine peptidase
MKGIMNNKKLLVAILSCISLWLIVYVGYIIFAKDNEKYEQTKILENYNEMYSLVKKINKQNNRQYDYLFGFIPMRKSTWNLGSNIRDNWDNQAPSTGMPNKTEYSDTNLQVLGVQEADIVKTDGEYIYALSAQYLYIVKASDGDLSITSRFKHNETIVNNQEKSKNSFFLEIYVINDKLIGIKTTSTYKKNDDPGIMPSGREYYYDSIDNEISAVIFDISDKSKPQKMNELSQTGNYISSRMIDNYLYITTNYYVYENNLKKDDIQTYVPSVKTDEIKPLKPEDIYIVPNPKSSQYVTLSGIDVNNAADFVSTKAIFGSGDNIYANTKNLFIASYDTVTEGDYTKSMTNLLKFSIHNGQINLTATGSVNGGILNQFSMDESDGYFRIVTTSFDYKIGGIWRNREIVQDMIWDNETRNNLYVLDKNLKVVSKIEDLAEGERVYSVRFDSDVAYFVTFRQVDPLFVVDLSDPKKPKVLSELKIPGFSEYLHVYNENLLFGFGKEADSDGRVMGIKISMFDISDKTDVTEKHKLFLGEKYSWSEASYNHKAILVASNRNIIGFPAGDSYLIYRFDNEAGFVKLHEISFGGNKYYYSNIRGLYIDDYFYIYTGECIESFDMENFTLIVDLDLNK